MAIANLNGPLKGTTHALPSPSGTHIASLTASQLCIRSSGTLALKYSFQLPSSLLSTSRPSARPSLLIRWSPTSKRILVASTASILVYSLLDPEWRAHISNGSAGMGRIINVEFGSGDDEALMWTEFGASLMVWDLRTGKNTEIKDPKFHCGLDLSPMDEGPGWAYQPLAPYLDDEEDEEQEQRSNSRIYAVLSRVGPRDILSIHESYSHKAISCVNLSSIDARGLKWSPDGRWLAIWEAPAQGMKIWIYTADGHMFRTYSGGRKNESEDAELGIRCLEWSPNGEWLALGGFDRRVTLLNTRTFSPLLHLDHTSHAQLPVSSPVYTETLLSLTKPERSYTQVPQPFTLPTTSSFTQPKGNTPTNSSLEVYSSSGISCLAFNPIGTLLATLSPTYPSTIWIWDLQRLVPRAVIVQSQPVKRISWAPNRFGLLLIQCRVSEPVMYLWDAEGLPAVSIIAGDNGGTETAEEIQDEAARRIEAPPQILNLPLEKRASGKASRLEATWLPRRSDQAPAFVFGDSASFIVVRPRGSDPKNAADEADEITSQNEDSDFNRIHNREYRKFKSRPSDGSGASSNRPATPHGDESEDSLYEILTGKTPVRVQQIRAEEDVDGETMRISDMVDAEEGEDDFTRMDDTFAGKKGMSLSDDSEIF